MESGSGAPKQKAMALDGKSDVGGIHRDKHIYKHSVSSSLQHEHGKLSNSLNFGRWKKYLRHSGLSLEMHGKHSSSPLQWFFLRQL